MQRMYYEVGNNNIINLKIEKHEQNEHLACWKQVHPHRAKVY